MPLFGTPSPRFASLSGPNRAKTAAPSALRAPRARCGVARGLLYSRGMRHNGAGGKRMAESMAGAPAGSNVDAWMAGYSAAVRDADASARGDADARARCLAATGAR